MRLQGSRFTIFRFSEIEEHNMGMQLRSGVSIHRAGAVVFEARCDPFTSRFRDTIAAHASLNEPFHFVQCNFDTVSMSLAHGLVSAHESSQRNTLRSRERRVPPGAVLHRADRLASLSDVFTCGLVPH